MNMLYEIITIAEGNELIGRGRTYLNDMIASGKLVEGFHYREAGRVKLIRKSIVEKIKNGGDINILGKSWGELEDCEKKYLLEDANCVDGITGSDAIFGECIIDLTGGLAIIGNFVDGEIAIDNKAIIYNPTA